MQHSSKDININNFKNEFDLFKNQIDINFINNLKTIINQQIDKNEFNDIKDKNNKNENVFVSAGRKI